MIGLLTIGADSVRRRPAPYRVASNLATFTVEQQTRAFLEGRK